MASDLVAWPAVPFNRNEDFDADLALKPGAPVYSPFVRHRDPAEPGLQQFLAQVVDNRRFDVGNCCWISAMASATLGPAKVPEKGTSGRLASLSGSSPRMVPVIMPAFFPP